MRRIGSDVRYSPSDLTAFMESEFACWMNRLALEEPNKVPLVEDPQEGSLPDIDAILAPHGDQHEREVLAALYSMSDFVSDHFRTDCSKFRGSRTYLNLRMTKRSNKYGRKSSRCIRSNSQSTGRTRRSRALIREAISFASSVMSCCDLFGENCTCSDS